VSPLRFHVTQQRRDGDRHVYGARSRFMSDRLLGTMENRFAGRSENEGSAFRVRSDKQIDVAERMRQMW